MICENKTIRTHCFPLTALALCVLSAMAQADPPKSSIAVFKQEDPLFSETIELYADGHYQQSETQTKTPLYQRYAIPYAVFGNPVLESEQRPKRSGTWILRSQENGLPIKFKPTAGIPVDAAVELINAMPFGLTWDNQFPYRLHGDRILPAREFQAVTAAAQVANPEVIVSTGALPPVVKRQALP